MMSRNGFAVSVALFNGLLLGLGLALITHTDALLTTHYVYGARVYPFGYPVALLGGAVTCLGTYVALTISISWRLKVVIPSLVVLAVGAGALPFFRPEFPHAGLVQWTVVVSVVSLLTCLIEFCPVPTSEWIASAGIPQEARIRRVAEYASLWRAIAVSSLLGTVLIVMAWTQFVWSVPDHVVAKASERFFLGEFGAYTIMLASSYVLFGVVYGSFRKANSVADNLLEIR